MTRILTLSILLASVLSTQASLLTRRQEGGASGSLDQVYSSLETFATEVATKIGGGECTEEDSCGGWLQSAMACVSNGSTDEAALAACACQQDFQTSFATCVTCVGTDSATQTGQAASIGIFFAHDQSYVDPYIALSGVCSSDNTSSAASSDASESGSSTTSESASESETSSSASDSASGTASSVSTTEAPTSSGNAASPTETPGSGGGKVGLSAWTGIGFVASGLIAILVV
ncbi:hypothetical protein JCM16303_001220 [Sporobolomyces ruberrimus]